MEWKDFEALLERGAETQNVDFKESCAWNVKCFAKDILAMSNIEDGGFLIIGMREIKSGFERIGISETDLQTYNIDLMKDQLSSYADPRTDLVMHIHSDNTGKNYIFIKIFEFDEVPVICKKECKETKQNIIYYRNSNRRPESAPISNTSDLRNLLERAAIKLMKKYHKLGLKISTENLEITSEKPDDKTKYKEERQGIK